MKTKFEQLFDNADQMAPDINAVYEAGMELVNKCKWISVEDGLPDIKGRRCIVARLGAYLAWNGPYDAAVWSGECFVSDDWESRKFIGQSSPQGTVNNITHWMPLPEPPEESE